MANGGNIRRKKRKNSPVKYIVLALVLTALGVVAGAGAFFKVAQIEIVGNERYSADMIIQSSGIKEGAHMYSINLSLIELNISKKLSYVDSVEAEMIYPDRVRITVDESYPIASLFVSGDWWILDKNARLLEYSSPSEAEKCIVITGLEPIEGKLGGVIQVWAEDKAKLERLTNILTAIYSAGLEGKIRGLDITQPGNITLQYGQNITVLLGSGAGADEKLLLFAEIAPQLDDSVPGTVSLGENGQANYTKH